MERELINCSHHGQDVNKIPRLLIYFWRPNLLQGKYGMYEVFVGILSK